MSVAASEREFHDFDEMLDAWKAQGWGAEYRGLEPRHPVRLAAVRSCARPRSTPLAAKRGSCEFRIYAGKSA